MFHKKNTDENYPHLSQGLRAAIVPIKTAPELVAIDAKMKAAKLQIAEIEEQLKRVSYQAQFEGPSAALDEKTASANYLADGTLPSRDTTTPTVSLEADRLHCDRRILNRALDVLESRRQKIYIELIMQRCRELSPLVVRELAGPALESAKVCIARLTALRELYALLSHFGMSTVYRSSILQGLPCETEAIAALKRFVEYKETALTPKKEA